MEMLILLNGILIACNVHLLIKHARKDKTAPATLQVRKEKNSISDQFANIMAYDGNPQEVRNDED